MKNLIDKNNLVVAISHMIAGFVIMVGSINLVIANHYLEIAVATFGFLIIVLGVFVLFKCVNFVKFGMPILYLAIGILYLIGLILDATKGYFTFGFVTEIITMILFIAFSVVTILKNVLGMKNIWIHFTEVVLSFLMASTIFFTLFSDAFFGYRFTKMNQTVALQIFYLLLIFGGYTILAISTSLYPIEEEKKKSK